MKNFSAIDEECRLCGGHTNTAFRKIVLGRYSVAYQICSHCGSLQTERPHWIAEAYRSHLNLLDTGAAQRNIRNLGAATLAARAIGARNLLDFGGGDGLLCRLLRDHGLNCYVRDAFGTITYAPAFTYPDFSAPELILGFEVIEHFTNPRTELGDLFDSGARALLLTTEIFNGQDGSWWYLAPEMGQHVFFYAERALASSGRRAGYDLLREGSFLFLYRPDAVSPLERMRLSLLLKPVGLRLHVARLMLKRTAGVDLDFARLRSLLSKEAEATVHQSEPDKPKS